MSRTTIVIVAVVAAALCAAVVLLVWRPFDDGPPIQSKALGVWQESTESLPVRLTVSAAGEDPATAGYWVTYPSMSDVPYPARLDADRILVLDADGGDVRWVVRYDAGADALIVSSAAGGETHVLRRVSK